MQRDGVSPRQSQRLEKIGSAAQHLLTIINDILDLSKIEAGRLELTPEDFSLVALLDNVNALISDAARLKGLSLRVELSDVPHWLYGDVTRLRQALLNFASNAVKFTDQGGIVLSVCVLERQEETLLVRFEVRDSGIGLLPEQRDRLFRAFEQADASTTRKYGGTGLGLAICKQLVEMMGGTIGIESQEGEGSTFWFTVVFETPALAFTVERIGGRGVVPGEARILIADDDPTNRFVALAQVEKLGYKADAVADGAGAVEALRRGGYDLVLMDCEMPVMDGYEATRRIRESGNPRVPIIAVTGHAMPGDSERCMREGMDDYLSKPLELQRLGEVLAKWLHAPGERG
jgi:CheY-like chemotaxis protein